MLVCLCLRVCLIAGVCGCEFRFIVCVICETMFCICTYIYLNIHICIYEYIRVHKYVCMYLYTHTPNTRTDFK